MHWNFSKWLSPTRLLSITNVGHRFRSRSTVSFFLRGQGKFFYLKKKIISRFKQGEVFPVLGISHLWIYTCTLLVLCVCVEVLRPSQQLRSCRASQLPINTVPGQFTKSIASAFRELLSIYVFSYFPFGFEGRMLDLIVSVPDHCLSFYLDLLRGSQY